jgi:hypothetical protein
MHKTGSNTSKSNKCATGREDSNSCFTLNELHEIAKNYNEKNTDKIQLYDSKEKMVNVLHEKFKSKCSSESCWPTLDFIKNSEDLNLAFKPEGPPGQFEWLSTTEINECMERYMNKYPSFLFIGAVPIDIRDLNEFGVNTLKYDKLIKKGKTQIGIIFNLDEHYKSGSHWVAFYIDFNKKQMYYSDSAGKPPEKRVKRLVKKLAEKWYQDDIQNSNKYKSINKKKISLPIDSYMNESGPNILEQKYDIKFNTLQHQYGGSECGVYSINFIVRTLRGDDFNTIHNIRIPDKEINTCRKSYFKGYDNIINNNDDKHIC